jgi:hypothetical protein
MDAGVTVAIFNTGRPDYVLHGDAAKGAYGDKNAEWIVFSACKVLNLPSKAFKKWFNTMNGLHLLLGWSTNAPDKPLGEEFGRRLLNGGENDPPQSVQRAWMLAVQKYSSYWQASPVDAFKFAGVAVGEGVNAIMDEYVWGEGPVQPDPVHDETKIRVHSFIQGYFSNPEPARGRSEGLIRMGARSPNGVSLLVPPSLLANADLPPPPMSRYTVQPVTADAAYVSGLASQICSAGGPARPWVRRREGGPAPDGPERPSIRRPRPQFHDGEGS